MLGLDVGAAVLTRFIAREENHASRLLRVPFKHEVTPRDSLKTLVPNRPIPSVRLIVSASQLLPTLPRALLRRLRGKVNGRCTAKWTVVRGCLLSREVGRDSGTVETENTTRRNFKDLEGMLGNAKALKRNNRECKGILIGPLMAPRFFRPPRFRPCHCPSRVVGFGLKFRGAGGKPT
jgi:hypothetical protein